MPRITGQQAKDMAKALGLPPAAKRGKAKTPMVVHWDFWGIPEPVAEHRVCKDRRWRFDWAWVEDKVALEVQGGCWTHGKHSRGKGQLNDFAKANRAVVLGWKLLYCTPSQIESGEIMPVIRQALGIE